MLYVLCSQEHQVFACPLALAFLDLVEAIRVVRSRSNLNRPRLAYWYLDGRRPRSPAAAAADDYSARARAADERWTMSTSMSNFHPTDSALQQNMGPFPAFNQRQWGRWRLEVCTASLSLLIFLHLQFTDTNVLAHCRCRPQPPPSAEQHTRPMASGHSSILASPWGDDSWKCWMAWHMGFYM